MFIEIDIEIVISDMGQYRDINRITHMERIQESLCNIHTHITIIKQVLLVCRYPKEKFQHFLHINNFMMLNLNALTLSKLTLNTIIGLPLTCSTK